MWCLLAHKSPIKKDPQRVIKYKKCIEKVDLSRGKQHRYNKGLNKGCYEENMDLFLIEKDGVKHCADNRLC